MTRCYPGRHASGRGDRVATPREQDLCSFWHEWELRLLRPELILVVGALAARRLLGVTSIGGAIGRRLEYGAADAYLLPHPSGRSLWLNSAANRERLAAALGDVRAAVAALAAERGDGGDA